MKIYALILSLMIVFSGMAQNNFSIKKGDIKNNGTLLATYDGKGGVFKIKKIGVFLPGSKDTLISITEDMYDPGNPLWPDMTVFYSIKFPGKSEPGFLLKHPKFSSGRIAEKDVVELLFRDTLPSPVNNGQLDLSAIAMLREKHSYDHEKVLKFIKGVEDTIAMINANIVKRDKSKPVSFKTVKSNSDPMESSATLDVYQDNVLLGRVIKTVRGGSFPKATYTVWKSITPVMVDGIDLKWSPVATCSTSPTPFDITVLFTVGKGEMKIKGDYAALEATILNVVIANGSL